ncbi:hypothetical protein PIB30_084861 [Stylosanthes scabra]|uniref:Uncharacterized protein n=1 Tax=Stylosanthes scabra TaxID=79078 RepID=A0ABU6SSX4_9FABA|nr:hypothetical protein [Stylosanthes scabra]
MKDLRPISIQGSIYKVMLKILMARLRPLMGNLMGLLEASIEEIGVRTTMERMDKRFGEDNINVNSYQRLPNQTVWYGKGIKTGRSNITISLCPYCGGA